MLLNYLPNWPKIPEELHQDVLRIVENNPDELDKFVGGFYSPLKLYPIDGLLKEWLHENISLEFGSCFHVHVISSDLLIHRDYMDEKYKVNYIFKTGGPEVSTNFYDDQNKLIESHVLVPFKWHWFDGTVLHNATNIKPGEYRVAITLGTNTIFTK